MPRPTLLARLPLLGLLASTAGLLLALGPTPAMARQLQVVATVPDLAAIAAAVGGDHVVVQSLALPTQDPHFVDARPNLALALNRADLLVQVGLDLEVGWLPVLLKGARNGAILPGAPGHFDASTVVALKDVPRGKLDRSMGDIHPGGNPHFLLDPENAGRVATAIGQRLGTLDPEHAEIFRSRAEAFVAEARQRQARWKAAFAGYAGRPVVTYHKSWLYLLDWIDLAAIGTIEPKPGVPPSPSHIGRLLIRMRQEKPAFILQEAYYPDATARLLGEKAGTPVVVVPGGTDVKAGESWLDHMDHVVEALLTALGGPAPARTPHRSTP